MRTSLLPSQNSSASLRKQLSVINENVTIRVVYEFIFVGSSAVDVMSRLFEADMNEAMTELAEKAKEDANLTRTTTVQSKDRRKLYVKLTEDESELAKIGCIPMASFDDTVPDLKDDAAVRTNLFIFIHDTQSDEPDFRPMEVLNMMFAQMQFQYRNLMRRKEKPPALRALVVRNSGIAMTEPEEQALLEFEEKLREFTRHGPLKKLEWSVDLNESDELYDFIEEIAQMVGRPAAMNCRAATTRWSKVEGDKTEGKNKSSSICCVL